MYTRALCQEGICVIGIRSVACLIDKTRAGALSDFVSVIITGLSYLNVANLYWEAYNQLAAGVASIFFSNRILLIVKARNFNAIVINTDIDFNILRSPPGVFTVSLTGDGHVLGGHAFASGSNCITESEVVGEVVGKHGLCVGICR